MRQANTSNQPKAAATPRHAALRPIGWVEVALVCAAMATIAVGALSVRLGPRWAERLFFRAPRGIVIHHTATGARVKGRTVNAKLISEWHQRRGWGANYRGHEFHIGYNYVILPDGTIEEGRPEWMRGAHTRGHNDYLGICLVGNFDPASNPHGEAFPERPTQDQLDALTQLLRDLLTKYDLSVHDIYRHSDLGATKCPGDRFPMAEVIGAIEEN